MANHQNEENQQKWSQEERRDEEEAEDRETNVLTFLYINNEKNKELEKRRVGKEKRKILMSFHLVHSIGRTLTSQLLSRFHNEDKRAEPRTRGQPMATDQKE